MIKHKYTTAVRCACVKNGTGCKVNCRCKNCENPCGQRSSVDVPRRKHAKHEWQAHQHVNSREFAQKRQEELSDEPLTKVEFFLLEDILVYCDDEDIEAAPANISVIYERILASVGQNNPNIPLRRITEQQIDNFLRLHHIFFYIFRKLCEMQLDWN